MIKLEPVEIAGLAKILGVKITELVERVPGDESQGADTIRVRNKMADVIINEMMERFYDLPKWRRKEILEIMKSAGGK